MKAIWNMTKKELVNTVNTESLQDMKGQVIKVEGLALIEVPDNYSGSIQTVGILKTTDGAIISTISNSAVRGIAAIIDFANEEHPVNVQIEVATSISKNGSEFITLNLL